MVAERCSMSHDTSRAHRQNIVFAYHVVVHDLWRAAFTGGELCVNHLTLYSDVI